MAPVLARTLTAVRRASLLLVLAALAGCGGSDAPPRPVATPAAAAPLTAAERREVARYEARIQRHCVRVARSVVDRDAAPTQRQQARAFAAADALVALAAAKPTAPVDAGQDLRLLVSDVVENLEGSNCDPRLVGRLEAGLARIPVE